MRESKSGFSLEPKERVLWEKTGILKGLWNATCITDRNIYLDLKWYKDIKKIPYKKTTGMLYLRLGIPKSRGWLYLYQSKFPAYELPINEGNSELPGIIMREIVRERSQLQPKIQRKEIRKLEKELYHEIQDELDFYKIESSKWFLSLFLRAWFKRTEFSVLTKEGLRKLEKRFGDHQGRIGGNYKFWGRGSWYNPVFIFKDWLLNIQETSLTLIARSNIYLWYLDTYMVLRPTNGEMNFHWVKKYANLKLCTHLGQYKFDDIPLESFNTIKQLYNVDDIPLDSFQINTMEQWLFKIGKLFSNR